MIGHNNIKDYVENYKNHSDLYEETTFDWIFKYLEVGAFIFLFPLIK